MSHNTVEQIILHRANENVQMKTRVNLQVGLTTERFTDGPGAVLRNSTNGLPCNGGSAVGIGSVHENDHVVRSAQNNVYGNNSRNINPLKRHRTATAPQNGTNVEILESAQGLFTGFRIDDEGEDDKDVFV